MRNVLQGYMRTENKQRILQIDNVKISPKFLVARVRSNSELAARRKKPE